MKSRMAPQCIGASISTHRYSSTKRRAPMTHAYPGSRRAAHFADERRRAELREIAACHECAAKLALRAVAVHAAVRNRLIDDDVPVSDFDIVKTRGVGAHPRFVLNGCAL